MLPFKTDVPFSTSLIISYEKLVITEINTNIPWNKVILDTSENPTMIHNEVFKEIINSPIDCTDAFIQKFIHYHGDISNNENSQFSCTFNAIFLFSSIV